MWYLPGLGTEPVCPALASGFLATRPQGKSCTTFSLSIPLLMDVAFRSLLFGSWAIVCQPLVLTHGFLFSLMDLVGLILHYHYIFWCSRLFQFGPVGTASPYFCVPLPHCSLRVFWLPHTPERPRAHLLSLLNSAISPRSPDSFHQKRIFGNHDLHVLIAAEVSFLWGPLSGQI